MKILRIVNEHVWLTTYGLYLFKDGTQEDLERAREMLRAERASQSDDVVGEPDWYPSREQTAELGADRLTFRLGHASKTFSDEP
jgi:hypothetical protein